MAKLLSGTRIYGTATVDSTLTLQDLVSSAATANIANTTSTTVNAFGAATTLGIGGATGTLTLSNPTIATSVTSGTLALFDTGLTGTMNIGGAAGTFSIGSSTSAVTFNGTTINLNGTNPSIASSATGTASVFNANITAINFGQAADITMSATGKTVTVNGSISIKGNTTLGDASGDSVTYTASTGTVTTTHAFTNNDAGTNTVVYPIKFAHTLSSGTAATGIGSGFQFTAPNASGSVIAGGSIEAISTNVTATSEAYDVVVKAYTAGSSGQVLKVNGTTLEVGASNSNTTIKTLGTGTLTVTGGTTGASSAGATVTVSGGAGGATTGAGGQGVFKGGDGTTSSAGGVATLKGGAAVGTNITGANTVIEAGNGTGSGGSGNIVFRTASAGSSGASADTMTDRLTISSTGNISFAGPVTIGGDLTVNGTVTTINSSTVTIDDKNIELASVAAITGLTVTLTNGSATVTFIGASTTTGLLVGQTLTITSVQSGSPAFGVGATILSVDSLTQVTMTGNTTGTTGNVTVSSSGSSDATADGGGITVKGATDKTWSYVLANTAWTSNQNIDIASTKTYKINASDVLSASAVLQNAGTVSVGATGSGTTVNVGGTTNNNTLNIQANGTTGTATLGTNVTNGIVNVFTGVTGTANYSDSTLTITVGNSVTASQSVSIATGATLNGSTKTINIGTAGVSGSTTNITLGSIVSGATSTTTVNNTLKVAAGTTGGTAYVTTDVTTGTLNIAQSVTGTVKIGLSGTIQLGTSASVVTTAQVGGAVDGNTLKIVGTAAGTVNITSDVTTGSVSLFAGTTTGTVTVGSAAAGTLAIAFNKASTSTTTGAVTIAGGLGVSGAVNAQTKSFIISHPTKPGKLLKHGSLEGPEFGVYVRGRCQGKYIQLPDYWLGLVAADSVTVDLTPIGSHQKLYVEKIEGDRVYIANDALFGRSVDCFYTVWGARKDVAALEIEADE